MKDLQPLKPANAAPPAQAAVSPARWNAESKGFWAVLGLAAVLIGGVYATIAICQHFMVPVPLRIGIGLAWFFGLPLAVLLLHYPGSVMRSHCLVIHAAPDTIWNTIRYRDTTSYYLATVARFVRISTEPEIYCRHSRDLGTCTGCGLPKPLARIKAKSHVEIVERFEGRLQHTRSTPAPDSTGAHSREEHIVWRIEPHADGALVTYTNISVAPPLWYWLETRLRVSHVARNILTDLKGQLDGTPDHGLFAVAREDLAFATAARKHCSCD